jgi:hypothetical protein
MNNGGYPVGAAEDPNAPYNAELDVVHELEISASVSYKVKVNGPEDMDMGMARDLLSYKLESDLSNYSDVCVDEFIIM